MSSVLTASCTCKRSPHPCGASRRECDKVNSLFDIVCMIVDDLIINNRMPPIPIRKDENNEIFI